MSVIYINEDNDKNKTSNNYKDNNVDMDNDHSNGRSIFIGQAIKAPHNTSIILHTVASCLEMGRAMPL